ncbi:MAG TPA: hypothetical protein VL172_11535 [Kofleriaceae bacterium]|jgi:hypothetical protein|nr:hypothetical protein [Kofleriaceae bacterium]
MKRTVIGLLVLLSSSVARGEELRAALAREAGGKPVMLVADAAGLTALTPDRAFSRVLVAGAIKYAAHDPAKDLVWLLRGSTLEVVDLRAPTAVAVKIATGVAQESFEILGASSTTWSGDRNSETYLELTWGKKPSVALHSPVITDCDGGDIDRCERRQKAIDKKGARKVKLVGTAWLKSQLARPARKAATASATTSTITLPAALAACDTSHRVCGAADCWDEEDDESLCGQARAFGATALQLVVVGSNSTCAFYDPARKLFAGPAAPTVWSAEAADPVDCDGIQLDAGGTVYTLQTSVCVPATGCTDVGKGTTLFWLDPRP